MQRARANQIQIEVRAQAQARAARCAFCHDSGGSSLTCTGCGVALHAPCWEELARCPSIGCESRLIPSALAIELLRIESATLDARIQRVIAAFYACGVVAFVAIGAVLWASLAADALAASAKSWGERLFVLSIAALLPLAPATLVHYGRLSLGAGSDWRRA